METVNTFEVQAMAGGHKNYVANKLQYDPTFPRPIIEQKGFPSVWFKKDIEAYLARQEATPQKPTGKNAVTLSNAHRQLDLVLALQFISAQRLTATGLRLARHTHLILTQRCQHREPVC